METATANAKEKKVRIIAETINSQENTFLSYRRIRVAAYCRVSTKQEEQINSYEVQKKHYTEKINESRMADGGHFCRQGHHRNECSQTR